jgi:hypothetical protein
MVYYSMYISQVMLECELVCDLTEDSESKF